MFKDSYVRNLIQNKTSKQIKLFKIIFIRRSRNNKLYIITVILIFVTKIKIKRINKLFGIPIK